MASLWSHRDYRPLDSVVSTPRLPSQYQCLLSAQLPNTKLWTKLYSLLGKAIFMMLARGAVNAGSLRQRGYSRGPCVGFSFSFSTHSPENPR